MAEKVKLTDLLQKSNVTVSQPVKLTDLLAEKKNLTQPTGQVATTEVSSTSSIVSGQELTPSTTSGENLPPITLDDSSKQVTAESNTIPQLNEEDILLRDKFNKEAQQAANLESGFTKKQDSLRAKEKTLGWKKKIANYLERIIGNQPEPTEGQVVAEVVDDPTPIDINAPIELDRQMYGINPETGFPTLPENIDPELKKRVFMSATKSFDQSKKDFEQIKPVLETIKTVGQAKRAMGWISKDLDATAMELSQQQKQLDADYKKVRELNKDKLRELGAWESFENGIDQTTKANDVADALMTGDDSELSKTLEDEYMKNVLYGDREVSEVSQMLGGQVKPLGVVFTSALLSGGNPLATGAAGTAYYGRMGAGGEAIQTYVQARSQGMSTTDALNVAKKQAVSGGLAGAAEGLVGSTMPVAKALKPLLKISSPMAKAIITGAAEAGTDAIAAAGAQTFNNYNANENGLIRDLSEGVADQATAEAMFSVGFQLLFHGAGKLSSANYNQLLSDYARYPLENIQFAVDDAVKNGTLDFATANKVVGDLTETKAAVEAMPKDIAPEKVQEVLPIVKEINRLEEENKNVVDGLKGVNEKKIEKLNGDLKQQFEVGDEVELEPIVEGNEVAENKEVGDIIRDGQSYADTPHMRNMVKRGDLVREMLPPVAEGYTRLYRGARIDEENSDYTNSLEGIALPFKDSYKGVLRYVDVPTKDLHKYEQTIGTSRGNEFKLPKDVFDLSKIVEEPTKENVPIIDGGNKVEEIPVAHQHPTKEKPYISKNERVKVYSNPQTGEVFVESADGKELAESTKRGYIREYKDNYKYDTGKDFDGEANHIDDIIDQTNNPAELADIMANEPKYIPEDELDFKERSIANNIGHVKRDSYIRHGDENNIAMGIAKEYLRKDGRPLDMIAMDAETEAYGYYDAENPRITEQDVIDFMHRYPSKEGFWKQKSETFEKARNRFRDLTGFEPDEKTIKLASNERTAKNKNLSGDKSGDAGNAEERAGTTATEISENISEGKSGTEQPAQKLTSLEEKIDGINGAKEKARNGIPEKELTKAQKAKQKFKEKLILAKALRDEQDNRLGATKDPMKEAEERAKADREVFDSAVEVAKEYIKETADKALHTVEEFAKYVDEKVEDVKAAWEAATKEPDGIKKTIVTKRAYEGTIRDEAKAKLEEIGLTRARQSHVEAADKAKQFIDEVGIDTALESVRGGDVRGAPAVAIINTKLEQVRDAMANETDATKIEVLAKEQADLFEEMGNLNLEAGQLTSMMNHIYQTSDLGYNAEAKIQEWKDLNGGEIDPETEARFREYDKQIQEQNKKIAELEKRAKEAEEKQAVADIKESVEREKKSKRYTAKARRVADEIRKLKNKPIQLVDENGNLIDLTTLGVTWNDIVEAIAKAVEAGGKLADVIENALKDVEWYAKLTDKGKLTVKAQIEDAMRARIPGEPTDKLNIPHSLIRDLVEGGADTIEKLVHEVQSKYPNKTEREIRDAITGYGKIINQNKEEIETKIRKMKRIGKVVSALEDIAEKKRPLRSGQQRDKLDAEERAMQKELREAMKELPVDEADLEQELKTQLDATKQRVQNQIEDLQREIDKGELTSKSARTVQADDELKALKEQRDALKKEHDAIFKDEEYKQARRLELTKKATQRRIEDLQRRIDEGDFSKKERKPLIPDTELLQAKAEKLRLQEQYDKEFYKQKLLNRTKAEKWKDSFWDAWGITRGLSATAEASFVGIQGLVQTIAHPLYAMQAFKNAAKFFGSAKKTEAWLRNIKSQEWYPTLKNSKLSLTEPHAEITAREELFYSGWTDLIWNSIGKIATLNNPKALEKWKAANPIKAVERASVGYLDTLRVMRFLDGMEILKEQGKTFENSPQDYKDVADAINTLTGRASLGALEQNAEMLSKIFFSPRNWASQFKTATPYALYHFGKMTPTARKMAIADFSKFVGLTTSMVMLTAAYLNNDDDEETGVEFDPRSSDFMKVKSGNTRVDPWGGRIQQVVLTARLLMDMLHDASPELSAGGMKTGKGEIVPLGTPFKAATKGGVALKMAINKLAPSAALLERYSMAREKKDGSKVDEYGKPYSFPNELKEALRPIYWGTVADLLKDDPTAMDGLLAFAAFFGVGVNVYDDKGKGDKVTGSSNINSPTMKTYVPKINMGKSPLERLERK